MQNQETDQLEIYKNLLLQAAKYHQPPREKTFFDTAIRKHYENPTTELLSFFLNPENEHGLGSVFFDGLTDAINTFNPMAEADDYGSVKKVVTELALTEFDHDRNGIRSNRSFQNILLLNCNQVPERHYPLR